MRTLPVRTVGKCGDEEDSDETYLPKKDQIESNHAAGARRAAPVDGPTQSAQVAGMADTAANSPRLPTSAHAAGSPPVVQLEVRHGTARPLLYTVTDAGFLIGR